MNELDPTMIKFREKQHTSSIDTLTNQLKTLEADVKIARNSFDTKINERDITKEVLRLKLEDTLSTLNIDVKPEKMSPTMLFNSTSLRQ